MSNISPEATQDVRKVSIQVATGLSKFNRKFENQTTTIGAFAARLAKPTVTPETISEYLHMTKAQQDDIKDIGGYVGGLLKGGIRNTRSVANRSIVTLDLDSAGDSTEKEVIDTISKALPGVASVVHSTHKHRPGCVRLRWVIFLSRPVFPDEYQAIARKIASMTNIEWFDDTTYEPARLMFWPSIPRDVDYVWIDMTNQDDVSLLDPTVILESYGPDEAWKDSAMWPVSSRQTNVIQREIGRQQNPVEKKGWVGAFCRIYDIHSVIKTYLSSVYRKDGGRYTYLEGSTSKGVAVYGLEHGDHKALWAYSNHATDPASGKLLNSFDLMRVHIYGDLDNKSKPDTPTHKLPSYKAMIERISEIPEVAREETMTALSVNEDADICAYFEDLGSTLPSPATSAPSDAPTVEPAESSDEWKSVLHRTRDGSVQACLANACTLIEHDESLKDMLSYNEFADRIEYMRKREWREEDTINVRKFLTDKYGLNFSKSDTQDAVTWRANRRRYHPVREYLESVNGTWDGVRRAERLWIDYIGEEDNQYTREAALCWLKAACMRIWSPGYKFDYVPVISGIQGAGKSTMCRILAKDWAGELNTFDDQKGVEQMKSKWICEISELAAASRHEIEEQKRFISATESTVRLSYRRDPVTIPRQSVFLGTTNMAEYLRDSTGNRRWWPLLCRLEKIDLKRLRADRDQIWAEVMYECADPDMETELSPEAVEIVLARQYDSRVSDTWEGLIREWVKSKAHKRRYDVDWSSVHDAMPANDDDLEHRDRACVQEIWQDCLGGKKTDLKKYDANRIASIMNAMPDWERKTTVRFGDRFGRQVGWISRIEIAPF